MENRTSQSNFTVVLRQQSTGVEVFLAAMNIFLSITACLDNALILIALRQMTYGYPPTKLLFRCLAVTDLCVGLIAQPFFSSDC